MIALHWPLGAAFARSGRVQWPNQGCSRRTSVSATSVPLPGENALSGPAAIQMAAATKLTNEVRETQNEAWMSGGKKKASGTLEANTKSALLAEARRLGFNRVVEVIIETDYSANCRGKAAGISVR